MKKLVFGVGVNDADYPVEIKIEVGKGPNGKRRRKTIWSCPFYVKWKQMLERCYSVKFQNKQPTYVGCLVIDEWLTFSNFKSWMEKQDWQDKDLDKDILVNGNRIYSPSTCIFIDHKINTFVMDFKKSKANLMPGVDFHKHAKKYRASCNNGNGKKVTLGYFEKEIDAHVSWVKYKIKLVHEMSKSGVNDRIVQALLDRYNGYLKNSVVSLLSTDG